MAKDMFIYLGGYPSEDAAKADYEELKKAHGEGWVGSYDVGIVVKDENGKIHVKRHTDSTKTGAWTGLAVGALLGVIFPPSVLVSGALGAGAGALIGHSFNDISKGDLKQIGDFLQDNEAALVILGESKLEHMVDKASKNAIKEYKKTFDADVKEFDKQLNKAMKDLK